MKQQILYVVLTGLTVGLFASQLSAQETPQAFQGAEIIPIEGDVIEGGTLVVQDGIIQQVGADDEVDIPDDAEIHDASDKVIMPGLVDTHSHVGEGDGGDQSAALHPDVRILDAINPQSDSFKRARTGGVTTANIMPGSGHLLSGQTVYVKYRDAATIYDMLLVDDIYEEVEGGMKMANGTNSIRQQGPFPGTRGKSAAMVREQFVQAEEYREQLRAAEEDEDADPPSRNLQMEGLVEVLDGDRIVHFHTHTHHDIMTAMRLSEEFGFRLVLQHVSEGWKVADEIAEAGVPASIIGLDSPGGKHEAVNLMYKLGPELEEAGADVAYHTDDGITDSRLFLRMAAYGVRAGMSREGALEALTIRGAEMMDLDDQIGSLVEGKDADFILLDGDPFSVYTHVQETWIDGVQVYDRSNPDHYPYSVGGEEVNQGHIHSHFD